MSYTEFKTAMQARRANCKYINKNAYNIILTALKMAAKAETDEARADAWKEAHALPLYIKNGGAYCEALEVIHIFIEEENRHLKLLITEG